MDPASGSKPEKAERSYLSAAVESVTWGSSRSSTPKLAAAAFTGEGSGLKNQHGGFQSTLQSHGVSSTKYPSDCPPMNAKWFYAVDVPKRKPKLLKSDKDDTKPLAPPKKFVTFSDHDSRAIEAAYQKLANAADAQNKETLPDGDNDNGARVTVPVQEDYLFDVDIERRELLPVYWLGPVYEVRRGSWFFQEGSTLRPCEENLATQLEEGYLKIKPFRYPKVPEKQPKTKTLGVGGSRSRAGSEEVTPKASVENLKAASQQAPDDAASGSKDASPSAPHQPQTHRLFGTYMNSTVTYQDSTVAWLSADSIMSRVSSTVYQKFSGGGYLGGVKIVRGYTEPGKAKEPPASDKPAQTPHTAALRPPNLPSMLQLDERQQKLLKRRSAPPTTAQSERSEKFESPEAKPEPPLPSLPHDADPEMEDEAARKQDEKEIQNDYSGREGEDQGREIEHLILVTHGIGEKIGRMNFVHNVNVLRKTLKSVYSSSADLHALNSEIDKLPKNCRVQVLPVCWRHLLDFPKKNARPSRKEHDLAEGYSDEDEYPSLDDITVEGMPFIRSLATNLALDILLYQSAYREHISRIVIDESNRIYDLFLQRNPYFKGKVSLAGHSLGSAVLFDILCRQQDKPKSSSHAHKPRHRSRSSASTKPQPGDLNFDFDVEHFYAMGSPIGIFQMLKSRTIAARSHPHSLPAESPMDPDHLHDPFFSTSNSSFSVGDEISPTTGLPLTVSSPKCAQLYNIIHPADPVSFRLEPLIAPAMTAMKPQALPYTKKTMAASVSGIGAKVGQSVSGLWSSFSSGIATSLINRSFGLTSDDVARMEASPSQNRPRTDSQGQSVGAGTNISGGGVIADMPSIQREMSNMKKKQLAEDTAASDRDGTGKRAPTLIDDDIETLYAGFQKQRKEQHLDESTKKEWSEAEERGKKLKREEMKVRALNHSGRVDFCIQESVLDFNPINTMASHLSYWADEDVSHFMMSQLLSKHRTSTRPDTIPPK